MKEELFSIKNNIEEISIVIEKFESFVIKNRITNEIGLKMNIVFDELLTNVIHYAFENDNNREINVGFYISDINLIISIEDDGVPFNPFHETPPDTTLSIEERKIGGLGIHLVKNLMDEYEYKRIKDHNRVTLTKYGVL